MVTIRQHESMYQAKREQDLLHEHGILSHLSGDISESIRRWVERRIFLQVPEAQAEEAIAIINALIQRDKEEESKSHLKVVDVEFEDWAKDYRQHKKAKMAFYCAFLSLIFPPFALYTLRVLFEIRSLGSLSQQSMAAVRKAKKLLLFSIFFWSVILIFNK